MEKSKLPADWEIAKKYRNDYLSTIRRAKADFVTSELDNNKNDTKNFLKNSKDVSITLTTPDSDEDIEDSDTACFNELLNIGQKLSANFNTPWYFDGQENGNKIYTIVATNEEVLKCCTDIDIGLSKSACVENISCRVLKDALIHLN